jgi:hypothetical protein
VIKSRRRIRKKKVKTSNSGGYYTLRHIGKCFRDDISKSINQTLYYESSGDFVSAEQAATMGIDQRDCSIG